MEDMTKKEEVNGKRRFIKVDLIHVLLKRAFEIDPELRVNVLYKDGTEHSLLYTNGKFCIKPNRLSTVWLDGELWRDVKISEKDHREICELIEKNEIADVSTETNRRIGFNFNSEKPPIKPSDQAALDLFTRTIWDYKPKIKGTKNCIELLYVDGMRSSYSFNLRKEILQNLSLKSMSGNDDLFIINIENRDVIACIAKFLINKAENSNRALRYDPSVLLKKTPIFTIGMTKEELILEITFVID